MATATFEHLFFSDDGTTILGPSNLNDTPGVFTLTYTDPLNVDETVGIVAPNGVTATWFYQGVTADGEVMLSPAVGDTTNLAMFTDLTYVSGNTLPAYSAATFCFLAGTLIATPGGTVPVETLAIGDAILTADGRAVPVKWLGWQTLSTRFGVPEHRAPVLIAAGALGEGLPLRDLRVTADHALLLDGALVQAGALVNGTSIRRMSAAELGGTFTVWHIETDAHDVILAEGLPAETFIDNVARQGFDNYAEFEALYGVPAEPLRELAQPRVMSARQVPASVRARIAERAASGLPHAA